MPQIFKALATVGIWGLYVGSWLSALLAFIFGGIMAGYAFGAEPVPMSYFPATWFQSASHLPPDS